MCLRQRSCQCSTGHACASPSIKLRINRMILWHSAGSSSFAVAIIPPTTPRMRSALLISASVGAGIICRTRRPAWRGRLPVRIDHSHHPAAGLGCGLPFDRLHEFVTTSTCKAASIADINQGRSKLYCVGWLSYLDNAGRMRITGFCRVLEFPLKATSHADNSRFRIHPDSDYEYED
jgi:hypothetical protein